LGVYDNLNFGPIGVFLFFQGLLSIYKQFNLKTINGVREVPLYVVGVCSRLLQLRNDYKKLGGIIKGVRVCIKYNVKGMEIIFVMGLLLNSPLTLKSGSRWRVES
jgi:hypothetical protein